MPVAEQTTPLTVLLQAWQGGDRDAFGKLIQHVHGELRRMARSRLRGVETPSLGADDLLSEALLKLLDTSADWQSRAHFFATVSRTMRSVVVDHARARHSAKRGGDWQNISYSLSDIGEESMVADLLTLDRLLDRLSASDPRAGQILQLTYFAGLQREEIAAVLDLSSRTVDRELRFARAWLSTQLQRELEA